MGHSCNYGERGRDAGAEGTGGRRNEAGGNNWDSAAKDKGHRTSGQVSKVDFFTLTMYRFNQRGDLRGECQARWKMVNAPSRRGHLAKEIVQFSSNLIVKEITWKEV